MHATEARANFAAVLDAATEDHDEVVITRSGKESAVVISLREYEALKETAYLLGTTANARRLTHHQGTPHRVPSRRRHRHDDRLPLPLRVTPAYGRTVNKP